MNKKAFTLIELLVVVLIIGILAAVALPQYQAAVLKSRLATVMTNVRSIANAMEIYRLANGTYPEDDDANLSTSVLDVQISGCTEDIGGIFDCPKETYDYQETGIVGGFLKNKNGLAYLEFLSHTTSTWGNPNTRQCWADSGNSVANQVCKSLGGSLTSTKNWRSDPSYGHSNNPWTTYVLP